MVNIIKMADNITLYMLSSPLYCVVYTDEERLFAIKRLADNIIGTHNPNYCRCAILYNHIKSLIYLHEILGCPIPDNACECVVEHYDIRCLQYIHEHGGNLNQSLVTKLVRFGNLDGLRYVHEHGADWPLDICDTAARHGNVHCLRYVHQHGAPWTENTTNIAIKMDRTWPFQCVYALCI